MRRCRLATTLLGSGGTGVTPGSGGAADRPGRVRSQRADSPSVGERQRLPEVRELRFVELYLSRATEAWEALKMQAEATPARYRVAEPIVAGRGSLRRPLESGYRGAEYDFITAETRQDVNGNTLHCVRARHQARAHRSARAGDAGAAAARSGRHGVERAEQRSADRPHALQPAGSDRARGVSRRLGRDADRGGRGHGRHSRGSCSTTPPRRSRRRPPWAIRSKLLRKFRTETFRAQVNGRRRARRRSWSLASRRCPPDYPPLPGALREAKRRLRPADVRSAARSRLR